MLSEKARTPTPTEAAAPVDAYNKARRGLVGPCLLLPWLPLNDGFVVEKCLGLEIRATLPDTAWPRHVEHVQDRAPIRVENADSVNPLIADPIARGGRPFSRQYVQEKMDHNSSEL
jgi:hypothetical protein